MQLNATKTFFCQEMMVICVVSGKDPYQLGEYRFQLKESVKVQRKGEN